MLSNVQVTAMSGLVLCSLVGVVPSEAGAMWTKMSVEELVDRSDLVVLGELVSMRPHKEGSDLFEVGTIQVSEVLVGSKGITAVSLLAPAREGGLRSSTTINYAVGQRGLWFLRRQPGGVEGVYLADHPQRLQPAESAEQVRAYLRVIPRP